VQKGYYLYGWQSPVARRQMRNTRTPPPQPEHLTSYCRRQTRGGTGEKKSRVQNEGGRGVERRAVTLGVRLPRKVYDLPFTASETNRCIHDLRLRERRPGALCAAADFVRMPKFSTTQPSDKKCGPLPPLPLELATQGTRTGSLGPPEKQPHPTPYSPPWAPSSPALTASTYSLLQLISPAPLISTP